jgi:DNA-binding IclR family transcriptional regulator
MTGRQHSGLKVLEKALDLLEVVANGQSLGLTELSREARISKASAFRILSTLERRGYLIKDPDTHRYRPGPELLAISLNFISGHSLVRAARPILETLHREFDETVNLGVPSEGAVLYLDIIESRHGLRMAAHIGKRDPLHSTALGKAILAALPDDELERILASYRWERRTPNTLVTPEALRQEVGLIRARGYATDYEENEVGARCVGVAICDQAGRPVGAISISGPSARLTDQAMAVMATRLQWAASEVRYRLGYSPDRSRPRI